MHNHNYQRTWGVYRWPGDREGLVEKRICLKIVTGGNAIKKQEKAPDAVRAASHCLQIENQHDILISKPTVNLRASTGLRTVCILF